jgi:hypothetical protein
MGRWAIINGVLGLLVVLIGFEIARTWTRALPPVEIAARPQAVHPTAEKHDPKGKRGGADRNAAAAAPAAMVNEIADKDLFDPSRQKAVEEVKDAAPAQRKTDPPPGVTVVGISIVGDEREAYVSDDSQGKQQRRLHPGDQVGGYTVKTIDVSAVQLTSPSNDPVTLELQMEKKNAATPGVPGRPGAAALSRPPGVPGQPGQPGQPSASPAAGVQAPSPAAGVGAPTRNAAQVPPRPGMPGGAPAPVPGAPQAGAPAPGAPVTPGAPGAVVQQPGGRIGRARQFGRQR